MKKYVAVLVIVIVAAVAVASAVTQTGLPDLFIRTRGVYENPHYNTTCTAVNPQDGSSVTDVSQFYLEINYTTDSPYRVAINWNIRDATSGWQGTYSMLDDMRLQHDVTAAYKEDHDYSWYVDIYTRNTNSNEWEKLWSNKNQPWTFTTTSPDIPGYPVADAGGPYSGYIGEAIQFDGRGSYDPDGTIMEYRWWFGVEWTDEDTAMGPTPTYTYTSIPPPGYYQVVLTVTDNDGYTASDTTRAYVSSPPGNQPPIASFIYNPEDPQEGDTITFDASSSYDPDGSISGYTWIFGDGHTRSGPNLAVVEKTYSSTGVFTVTLEVTDNEGSIGTATATIGVQGTYTLTTQVEPTGAGNIWIYPLMDEYPDGTMVTLTATANDGYTFSHWTGDISSLLISQVSNNPITVGMTSDRTITAAFTPVQPGTYTVAVQSNPSQGGHVELSHLGPYHAGDIVTLTAHAEPGYRFTHWSGDATGSDVTATLTVTGNMEVTANFESGEGASLIPIISLIIVVIIAVMVIYMMIKGRRKHARWRKGS